MFSKAGMRTLWLRWRGGYVVALMLIAGPLRLAPIILVDRV